MYCLYLKMLTNASQIHARTELHVPTHVDHLPVHVIRDGQVLSVIKVHENELELKMPLFLRSVAGLKCCAFCAECCALLSFDANAE